MRTRKTMLDALRHLIGSSPRPAHRLPAVPDGRRYYAVGDIHGRLDLYEAIIAEIEAEIEAAPALDHRIVLLGDLVDRGPDSAGVINRTMEWQRQRNVRVLAGNHEQMFLDSFDNPDIMRHFFKHGGRETVLSYGLSTKQFNKMTLEELFEAMPDIVPRDHLDYIRAFEECIVAGDYLFVHAGIDPALPIDQQSRQDMLWIRDRFLSHEGPLEKVVVHGHTIFDRVMDCGNRIGIDTGAFRSGVLTALVLEGEQRRTIQAISDGGQIDIFHGDRSL